MKIIFNIFSDAINLIRDATNVAKNCSQRTQLQCKHFIVVIFIECYLKALNLIVLVIFYFIKIAFHLKKVEHIRQWCFRYFYCWIINDEKKISYCWRGLRTLIFFFPSETVIHWAIATHVCCFLLKTLLLVDYRKKWIATFAKRYFNSEIIIA